MQRLRFLPTNRQHTPYLLEITLIALVYSAFGFISLRSEGSLMGGDSYNHYTFARYAFQHPQNLLNTWAKPVFTLFASPFALFGFHGIMLFNIIVCALATFVSVVICGKLNYRNGYMLIAFSSFAPAYILEYYSGLTEALFSLLLVAAVYYYIDNKYTASALIISLLPLVRSEGLLFILWFIFLLYRKRKFIIIPFLLFGTILYSVIGWYFLGDVLWLINKNPYSTFSSIYGSGSIFYYITTAGRSFGVLTGSFAIIGAVVVVVRSIFKNNSAIEDNNIKFNELFVVLFSALGFFLFHSIVWWKGWVSVLGDPRFMASIVPLISILALNGFNALISPIKTKSYSYIFYAAVSLYVIKSGLKHYSLPVKINGEDKTVKEAVTWIQNSEYSNSKIVYYNPIVPVLLNKDPFDNNIMQRNIKDPSHPEKDLQKNTIFIWDAHFGAFEGRLALDSIKSNPDFLMLREFFPVKPFKTIAKINYQVAVFLRK